MSKIEDQTLAQKALEEISNSKIRQERDKDTLLSDLNFGKEINCESSRFYLFSDGSIIESDLTASDNITAENISDWLQEVSFERFSRAYCAHKFPFLT